MKFRSALLALACAGACFGASTQTWEMGGYQDFSRGRLEGLSLSSDGKLTLGPRIDTLFDSGQAEIWSVAQAPEGSLYVGTGNRGRLFRVDAAGNSSLVWTAEQPEIFAVAVDAKGVVYAGTSPDGKVYRIENGKATEFFSPAAHYIWALAFAPDGALMVATGDEGKIFRVDASGRGSVYYETGQAHVTALAFDAQGRLLAGSEPNGILYRIGAQGKAFVLYDSSLPEIRTIIAAPDGSIYAAALGGGAARRMSAASAAAVVSSTGATPVYSASVTVTDNQAGLNPTPKPDAPKPSVTSTVSAAPVISNTSSTDSGTVEKSALYKISPDNTVETLWSSKEENIYDLALNGASLEFLTDAQGRIYRLDPGQTTTLVAQVNEADAIRLMATSKGLLAATGNLGKLLRLENSAAAGWFESPVHDSGTVARWGRLQWHGDLKGLAFRTRSGNSARPDTTWSDWSDPITDPARAAIVSPNARYIQWRAEFSGTSGVMPAVDDVTIAYLPQNTPPVVRSIGVSAQKGGGAAAVSSSSSSAYSVTVTADASADSSGGAAAQTISRSGGQQIQIQWQADDPDGDRLVYALYFRGEDESQWKLLRAGIADSSYTLDGDVLADGRYFFRVVASDRPSNPASQARESELVSAPVVIDNTPPIVNPGAPRRVGTRLEIDVTAEDIGSALRRCEYSVDAGPWSPVEAADGVADSARESFPIRVENFPQGEHLIAIRAYDAAGNAGLAKVVVR